MWDILQGRAKLQKGLAPTSDRHLLCDAAATNMLMSAAQTFHNPVGAIGTMLEKGLIGQLYGFKFWESETAVTHTNGTRTDTSPTIDTTSLINSTGKTTVTMTVNAAGTTIRAGDVFTIGGVYACNPETKIQYDYLQQFSVTTTVDATALANTCIISPIIYTSGPKTNIVIATASAAAVIVHVAAGGSGPVSGAYTQNLAYHKDAFTAVFADLEMPQGVHFAAREVYDGISLRVVRQYDVVNDKFPCRIDVLFGQKTIRPQWACRIVG